MSVVSQSIVAKADEFHRIFKSLIGASHRSYIDLETLIPWKTGVDKKETPKIAEDSWLYGTRYWTALSEEQRLETLWLETARDVSMFIHFEHFLPQLYGGYCNELRADLDPLVYEYLMLFSREELTHIMAFQRYRSIATLPFYAAPGNWNPFTRSLLTMRPEVGILFTLIVEWVAELGAMHATQSPEIEPLTRLLFREHHIEELRHLAFGKAISDGFFKRSSRNEAEDARQLMKRFLSSLIPAYTYNPEISSFSSFVFPIQANDEDAINEVRNSERNRMLNEDRFKDLFDWCKSQDIL
jgi:hypothetical protein